MPVAVNCCLVPNAIDGLVGVTAIDTSTAAVTASVVLPLDRAGRGGDRGSSHPRSCGQAVRGDVLLIVATVANDEPHCTVAVMSWVLPSVKVPVAVNCCGAPRGILGNAGVTAIETSAAGVTITLVGPVMPERLALTSVVPTATLLTTPWLFTVAIAGVVGGPGDGGR